MLTLPAGLVLLVLAGWAAYGVLVYELQDGLVFPAPGGIDRASLDAAAAEIGAKPVQLTAADGTQLYAWHRAASGDRAILYLHGNAETVAGSMSLQRLAHQEGWDFLAVAYRGYPGSEGAPSQAGVVLDARAAWDHLVDEVGVKPDRVVVHGRSLGGGVALQLTQEVTPAGLVLESTFRSVLELALRTAPGLPVERLLRHPFRSDLIAPECDVPTLVLHSRDDGVIPVDHGRWLAEALPNGELVEVVGHNHGALIAVRDRVAQERYLAWLGERVP
jgi:pimeloyl-ACP methyl ester carboxylesterase